MQLWYVSFSNINHSVLLSISIKLVYCHVRCEEAIHMLNMWRSCRLVACIDLLIQSAL